jgi:hypothetical protein
MEKRNRRRGNGAGFGFQLVSGTRGYTPDTCTNQHLLTYNNQVPPIIARHLRAEDFDVDGSIAWAQQIAAAAADWLGRRAQS